MGNETATPDEYEPLPWYSPHAALPALHKTVLLSIPCTRGGTHAGSWDGVYWRTEAGALMLHDVFMWAPMPAGPNLDDCMSLVRAMRDAWKAGKYAKLIKEMDNE